MSRIADWLWEKNGEISINNTVPVHYFPDQMALFSGVRVCMQTLMFVKKVVERPHTKREREREREVYGRRIKSGSWRLIVSEKIVPYQIKENSKGFDSVSELLENAFFCVLNIMEDKGFYKTRRIIKTSQCRSILLICFSIGNYFRKHVSLHRGKWTWYILLDHKRLYIFTLIVSTNSDLLKFSINFQSRAIKP